MDLSYNFKLNLKAVFILKDIYIFFQLPVNHLRIDLSCLQRLMPQHFTHGFNRDTIG